jgi:hypothetical protein
MKRKNWKSKRNFGPGAFQKKKFMFGFTEYISIEQQDDLPITYK